jgi:hypothetical protein
MGRVFAKLEFSEKIVRKGASTIATIMVSDAMIFKFGEKGF